MSSFSSASQTEAATLWTSISITLELSSGLSAGSNANKTGTQPNNYTVLTSSTAAPVPPALPPTTGAAALALKYIFLAVGVLGLVSNGVVLLVVLRVKKLRQQMRNWFIFHQSLADFINAAYVIVMAMRPALTSFEGTSGYLTCALWVSNFTYIATSLASAYILAALTIEIYMAIVHSVRHRNVFSHRLVALMVAIAWIIGIVYAGGLYLVMARTVNGLCYPAYNWAPVAYPMTILNVTVKMGAPLVLYATFNTMTLCFLRSKAKVRASELDGATITIKDEGNNSKNNHSYSRASHNVAKTVLYTLVIHVLAWTYNQTLIVMSAFGYKIDTSSLVYQLSLFAIYACSCVNPVVYAVKYKQFRSALFTMLNCQKFNNNQKPKPSWTRPSGDLSLRRHTAMTSDSSQKSK